jgi:hypothetical protein
MANWHPSDLQSAEARAHLSPGRYEVVIAEEGGGQVSLFYDNGRTGSGQWHALWRAGGRSNHRPLAAAVSPYNGGLEFDTAKQMALQWGRRELDKRPHLKSQLPLSQRPQKESA